MAGGGITVRSTRDGREKTVSQRMATALVAMGRYDIVEPEPLPLPEAKPKRVYRRRPKSEDEES